MYSYLEREEMEFPLGTKIEQELGKVVSYETVMRYLDDKYKQEQKRSPRGDPMEKSIKKVVDQSSKILETPEALRKAANELKAKADALIGKTPEIRKQNTERQTRSRKKKQNELVEKAKQVGREEAKKDLIENTPKELEE